MLTSFAIVGYVLAFYTQGTLDTLAARGVGLADIYAPQPVPIQIVFYLHITFAAVALLLGPLQFSSVIRRRYPAVHRWLGRSFLIAVGIGSAAALAMSFVNSEAFNGFFGFGTLAVLWAWTAWRGYRAIRNHDVPGHQAWMIRTFALTYAGVTLRAWLGLLIGVQLLLADPANADRFHDLAYAPLPFLCWLPNIVVAELIIRRRGLPSLITGATTPHRPLSEVHDRAHA